MRSTPSQIIDELRELAQVAVEDINEVNEVLAKVVSVPEVMIEETTEWQAADMLQCFTIALRKIARGPDNFRRIAEDALKLMP